MKNLAALLALLAAPLVCAGGFPAGATSTPANPIKLALSCLHTSGLVPLAVFCDSTSTTDASVTSAPFSDIQYSWTFGDVVAGAATSCGTAVVAGQGKWACGSGAGVNSKNSATGPVAAHVFESAGTYTITLTAYDGTNTVSSTATVTATAWANDTTTVCVSTSGDFTGCPSGATHATNTSSFSTAINNIAGSVKRLLFRAGETWTTSTMKTISAAGPGLIGSYGSGALPVISTSENDGNSVLLMGANDWRLMDLNIKGNSNNIVGIAPTTSGSISQITMLRLSIQDTHSGIVFDNGSTQARTYDQIALVDSMISHMTGGSGAVGAYVGAEHLSMLGNWMDDTHSGEHVIRLPYANAAVISNNTLSRPASTKLVIKLHAPDFPTTGAYSQYVVISDNDINNISGFANIAWLVAFGPQNNLVDERVRYVIAERNWLRHAVAAADSGVDFMISGTQYMTLRNNVHNMTGGSGYCYKISQYSGSPNPAPDNITIYNVSCYTNDTTASSTFAAVRVDNTSPGPTNLTVKNALAYAPNATSPVLLSSTPSVTVAGNSTDNQVKNTSPNFTTTPPVTTADFKPTTGYAIGGGASVPVWSDFSLVTEPPTRDIGAVNH